MHIVNVMFGRELGSIASVFIDYTEALLEQDNEVTLLVQPSAAVIDQLSHLPVTIIPISNLGQWDPFAKRKITQTIESINPDCLVVHGRRAIELVKHLKVRHPIIAVPHNYQFNSLGHADAFFCITNDLKKHMVDSGYNKKNIFHVPNMIRSFIDIEHLRLRYHPPVIGTFGKFSPSKGFGDLIDAITILDKQKIIVKVIIAGDGPDESLLRQHIEDSELTKVIHIIPPITNKTEFFNEIDLFCLPSLSEPFGINLLEAFMYGKPSITTDTEGSSEIATHKKNAYIVKKGNPTDLANGIKYMLYNQMKAITMGKHAKQTVRNYDVTNVSEKLHQALNTVLS